MDCGPGDDGMTGSGYRMSVCIDPGENFQVLKSNTLIDSWEVFATMTASGSETTLTDTSALGLPSGYYVLVFAPW